MSRSSALAVLILLPGCGGTPEPAPAPRPAVTGIAGKVRFDPKGPAGSRLPNWENPNGTIRNVFVFVKEGLGNRTFDPPGKPVVLDQKGFEFVPHVFGIMTGQKLRIETHDYTLHNVHFKSFDNGEFNQTMGPDDRLEKVFMKPETMVLFRCEHHPQMSAYMGVLPHPFFAVSGDEGTYEITGLPPGKYVVEAWEEKLGTLRAEVSLAAGESEPLDFVYR